MSRRITSELEVTNISNSSIVKDNNNNPAVSEKKTVPQPVYKPSRPTALSRLAAAASFSKEIPTAGWYAIEHSKEPEVPGGIPPECYIYDEDRPFVLGKLNKAALDYPEPCPPVPLPNHVEEYLNALEAAEIARINKERKAKDPEEIEKRKAEAAAAKDGKDSGRVTPKTKSRNPSVSPGRGLRKSTRSSTPSSPRPLQPKQEKGKLGKSPGRGDAPPAKVPPAPKKTVNAK